MEKVKIYTDIKAVETQKRNTLQVISAFNDAIKELKELGINSNNTELMQFLSSPDAIISTAIESAKAKYDAFYKNYPESDRPSYKGEPVLRARIVTIHRHLKNALPYNYDDEVRYRIENGVCSAIDNLDEALNEKYSTYCENENHLQAYNLAKEIISKVNELSAIMESVPDLASTCDEYKGLVALHHSTNEKASINYNLLNYIN